MKLQSASRLKKIWVVYCDKWGVLLVVLNIEILLVTRKKLHVAPVARWVIVIDIIFADLKW